MALDNGYRWRELGSRIREVRKASGMTQKGLSSILAVSQHAVWCWETGKMQPRPEHLAALAQVLGVSTDWLLGKSQAMEELLDEAEVSFRQAVAELSADDVETIRDFIQFVRNRRREHRPR